MDRTDVIVFDVGMGQSIFIYSHSHPDYGMMIDCGHTDDFHPIDFLIDHGYIKNNTLKRLLVTNYDHDHVSGLPYLRQRVNIPVAYLAKNLTSQEIKSLKTGTTEALDSICHMRDTYNGPLPLDWNPPYEPIIFSLTKEDFFGDHDTNNLSQVVFIDYYGTVLCVCGDMEKEGWELLSKKHPEIKSWLAKTNIFIAPHHGRDNGYHPELFAGHLTPECIIISDKKVVHDTQKDMASLYSAHVTSQGVVFNGDSFSKRKVLTTRSDGHLWISLLPYGTRIYQSFVH